LIQREKIAVWFCLFRQCIFKPDEKVVPADLNRAKRLQVRGDELAIQQLKPAHPYPRDQMAQSEL
jgi:hypothetical protein